MVKKRDLGIKRGHGHEESGAKKDHTESTIDERNQSDNRDRRKGSPAA